LIKRALALAACIAALMAAAASAVVALCFTLYALLRDLITPAGASAAVVGLCALIAGIAALIAYSNLRLPRSRPASRVAPPPTLGEQVLGIVRERPLISAGAALAAGLAAFANPALVTAVLKAFTDKPRNRG
jgi:uncharacterized membrane protein HdeD (DUF308 family)